MRKLIFIIALAISSIANAQTEKQYIRSGNDYYKDLKYSDAEVEYQKAVNEVPSSYAASFNLANAFYRQEKFDKARELLANLVKSQTEPTKLSECYYNLGNSDFALCNQAINKNDIQNALKSGESAMEDYKNSLKTDPYNKKTKFNYICAKNTVDKLKKIQDQQKNNQNQQQQNQQQNQDQNQDKQNQNGDGDEDHDGIPNSTEKGDQNNPRDTDGDGVPDYKDQDSDNDGIPDRKEAGQDPKNPQDTDRDGTPDYRDTDSNNDGTPDSEDAKAVMGISQEDAERILDAINKADAQTQQKVKDNESSKGATKHEKNW